MGKYPNPYSILAYIVADRFALLATCTELGGKASSFLCFRIDGHGYFC